MMWPPIPFLTSDPVPRHEEPTLVSAVLSISLPSPPGELPRPLLVWAPAASSRRILLKSANPATDNAPAPVPVPA